MSKIADHRLTHLPPVESAVGYLMARPKPLAIACIVTLTGAGWLYLGLMLAGVPGRALGPGMSVLDPLPRAIDGLCRPLFGQATIIIPSFTAGVAMWCAMALAMMLPSAGPTILTYAEIADTAAGKGKRVVSPLVIAAGFIVVWLGFAVAAASAQSLLAHGALLDPASQSLNVLFAGAIFIGAGLYQFSGLKHACLRLCQNPFSFFFTHWATTPRGVFRLGLRQGVYCLGCCWALMLVMFGVGLMNVLWMAALGIVMTIEKMTASSRFAHFVGVGLLMIGAATLFSYSGVDP